MHGQNNIKYRHSIYKRNTEERFCNKCGHGKVIRLTYYKCVSPALLIEILKHTRPIIFPSMQCLALLVFPTLGKKKKQIFPEKTIVLKKPVLIPSTNLFGKTHIIGRNKATQTVSTDFPK